MITGINFITSSQYCDKYSQENVSFKAKFPQVINPVDKFIRQGVKKAGLFAAAVAYFMSILNKGEAQKTEMEFADILELNKSYVKKYTREGLLVKEDGKYDINEESNQDFVKRKTGVLLSRADLAKIFGVDSHTINHHIALGRLNLNEDGYVDLTDNKNVQFCESYTKGKKLVKPVSARDIDYVFKRISKEYCIKNGLLILDENGEIDYDNPQNQEFLQKCKKGKISISDYIVTQTEFAARTGRTLLTINRAVRNGELELNEDKKIDIFAPKNAKYLSVYNLKTKNDKTRMTKTDLAKEIGCNISTVDYYSRLNLLEKEEDGRYDVTKECNRVMIEKLKASDNIGKHGKINKAGKKYKVVRTDDRRNISQVRFAQIAGISQATVAYHIVQEHIVLNKNGKIDLENPTNAKFILGRSKKQTVSVESTKKRRIRVPIGGIKRKYVRPIVRERKSDELSRSQIGNITGLSETAISYHTEVGRLVRNKEKLYDMRNQKNIEFLSYYMKKYTEVIKNASSEELIEMRKDLKLYISQCISKNQHLVAKELFDTNPSEFCKYIVYLTQKTFNTDDMSDAQIKELVSVVHDIVVETISNKSKLFSRPLFRLTGRCDIYLYDMLLDRLSGLRSDNI